MLVEVSGCDIRNRLDSAYQLLTEPGLSVRVKVGRPDVTSSIVSLQNGVEVRVIFSNTSPVLLLFHLCGFGR